MGIIGFLVAGLVIGALARMFKKGEQDLSLPMTLGLGVAGSVVGGLIASVFGWGSITELNVFGFIISVVAAVVLIGVVESRTKA